jgi:hypothetical protein
MLRLLLFLVHYDWTMLEVTMMQIHCSVYSFSPFLDISLEKANQAKTERWSRSEIPLPGKWVP